MNCIPVPGGWRWRQVVDIELALRIAAELVRGVPGRRAGGGGREGVTERGGEGESERARGG